MSDSPYGSGNYSAGLYSENHDVQLAGSLAATIAENAPRVVTRAAFSGALRSDAGLAGALRAKHAFAGSMLVEGFLGGGVAVTASLAGSMGSDVSLPSPRLANIVNIASDPISLEGFLSVSGEYIGPWWRDNADLAETWTSVPADDEIWVKDTSAQQEWNNG